jgi:hypothetical protein
MVRPIDLQDNLSKTQAAERMNQIQKAHGEMGQRQAADALKEKTSAEMEKAKASEKADMVIIRKEQDKEKRKRDRRKRKQKEDDRDHPDNDSSEHLDLKG